ncbi:hypothetical protein [Sulfobacillus thermosulfidooxidans]|uniref:hypothetical protein n=1 Tax=Sulfobacillus thermosulfidooxidans TaxID=28034 RepID=UPI0002E8CE97|nr:hypothetical protein [Sulfobacillus thermosulfidooxidans]
MAQQISRPRGYRIFRVHYADGREDSVMVYDDQDPAVICAQRCPGGRLGEVVYGATYDPQTGGLWTGD